MNRTDAVTGLIVSGVGVLLFMLAMELPDAVGQSYGPGFVPSLIARGLVFAGLWLTLRSLLFKRLPTASTRQRTSSWLAATLVIGLLLAYVMLAERLGFHITALLCVVPIMWLFTHKLMRSILISAIGILCIHLVFYNLLRVPLPWGVLQPFGW